MNAQRIPVSSTTSDQSLQESRYAPAALAPLAVVSPHYDDAVFSCGHLLASVPGSTVVTICTALPEDASILTDWDSRCGFTCASDAMSARAAENANALRLLRAEGMDLNFLDAQYASPLSNGTTLLSDSLSATLTLLQPATVCFPVGLFHDDHLLVSDVLMTICHHFPSITWLAYEDIPYRKRPETVSRRMDELATRGLAATPFTLDATPTIKEQAVMAYRSQFLGLGYTDASPIMEQPERYWRIHQNMELL